MPDHLRKSLMAPSPSQAVSEIAERKVAGLAASLGLADDMDTVACHIWILAILWCRCLSKKP
jgi:hypothetical protein